MYRINNCDGFVIMTFNYFDESNDDLSSHVEIIVDYPLGLHHKQIKILDDFFERIASQYIDGVEMLFMIERLKNGEIYIVAYLINEHQDYDFCGTFQTILYALHNALSTLFNLSVTNGSSFDSINADLPILQMIIEQVENQPETEDVVEEEFENQPDPEIKPDLPPKNQADLGALGQVVDDIFKDDGKNPPKKRRNNR